jgi:putative ABC transport system permease protein
MNIVDVFPLAFDALKEHKLRAALTIAMVVIGAALVTGLNGLTGGMNAYMMKQFSTLGANVIITFPASSSFRISEQVRTSMERIAGVKAAVAFIQQAATIESGSSTRSAIIAGVEQPKLPLIFPTIELAEGSFVSPYNAVGIVLGSTVANPPGQAGPFARYGQSVTIKYAYQGERGVEIAKRSFRVEGILSFMGTSGMFIPVDRMAFISLAAANSLFKRGGNYDGIFVVAASQDVVDKVVKEIRNLYSTNLEVYTAKSIIQMIQQIMGAMQILMGSIASVSLIVASVGILAGLYTSVMERTREIGVLKALGFKNWMVLMLFLSEAIIIGVIGGTLGNGIGVLLGYVMATVVGQVRGQIASGMRGGTVGYVPPVFTIDQVVFVWMFSVILSVFAGIYPAWRASKLDPVVALRKE